MSDCNVCTLKTAGLIALTLLLFVGCTIPAGLDGNSSLEQIPRANGWRIYQGAWFNIEYPQDFEIRPSLAAYEDGSFDSVFFYSRDGGVSFYILSSQWYRPATDIAFQTSQESQLESTEESKDGMVKRSKLIRARDGSYRRLVESFVSPDQTTGWTFQFNYRNDMLKEQYAPLYEHFKASLQQFAD